jgi:AraC family transcriptional regulator
MNPVQKALWYVESHSRDPITLEEIARACHVSAFHLTRAFAVTMGLSLMRYVRARRLSEAARQLAQGAPDILALALDAGYGSHEAFTRAFKDQFGYTPEQVRAQGHPMNIQLVEAITLDSTLTTELLPPRFETTKPMLLAGLVARYSCQDPAGIPDQWQRFSRYIGQIPGKVDRAAYGACYNFDSDSNFDYMCGVEVASSAQLPGELTTLVVPAQKYVVFTDKGHISGIRSTLAAIWTTWFPTSGHEAVNAPTLERYGPEFNPSSGMGGYEIWIAIKP